MLTSFCEPAILSIRTEGAAADWFSRAARRTGLATLLGGWKSDTVHRHVIGGVPVYEGIAKGGMGAGGFAGALEAWLRAGRKAFDAYCRANGSPDLVHAHGRFLNAGALAVEIDRMAGVPFVYTEHSSFFHRKLAPPAARDILSHIVDRASIFCAVSAALVREVETFLGRRLHDAVITPNVLDEIFESTATVPAPTGRGFAFVTIAALYPYKGLDVLLHGFKQAFGDDDRYRLNIIGDGPLRQELQGITAALGLEAQVTFAGTRSKPDVLTAIDGSHALVLSSRIETFGVVLIEALARGRPVIATQCGGPSDIVGPDDGILVAVDDVAQLATAMRTIAQTADSYDGDRIRDRALQRYGSTTFRESMRRLYDRARITAPPA